MLIFGIGLYKFELEIFLYFIFIFKIRAQRNTFQDSRRPQTVTNVVRTARSPSPLWHRKLRAKRSAARKLVRRLKSRQVLTQGQLRRCRSALELLCGHHTRPIYRISPTLWTHLAATSFPFLDRLMSNQWGTWKWQN